MMDSDSEMKNDSGTVELCGPMSIQRACELRDVLLSRLASARNITVDMSQLTEIDITGLQLLCAAHRSSNRMGGTIRLKMPLPEHVKDTLQASGFCRVRSCMSGQDKTCLWGIGDENE